MKQFQLAILTLISAFSYSQNEDIESMLQNWHQAAANADFKEYFDLMTSDAIFIGTDATENWKKQDFKTYAKPYFDRGKAWNFTTLRRNIFTMPSSKIAWFDELLKTQMGICRGSGIVEQTKNGWKVKHYVLSISIPNENVNEVTSMKKNFDAKFIEKINNEK